MNKFFISSNFNHLSNKKVSLMAVTRCSFEKIEKTISNIFETCNNTDNVEMLIRVDEDDPTIDQILNSEIFHKYNTKLYAGVRHGYSGMNEYYNELIAMSTGDLLFHWGSDVSILTHGWDDILSKYIGRVVVLQNMLHYNTSIGFRAAPDINFSPVVPRLLYDLFNFYSPCVLSDCFYDYIGEIVGIKELSGIDVMVLNDEINEKGMAAWGVFSSQENMSIVTSCAEKVIDYLDNNNIDRRQIPYFVIGFNPSPKLEIRGGLFSKDYTVEFIHNDNVFFNISISTYHWVNCSVEDYTPWLVRVSDGNGDIIFEHNFNLSGKKAMIEMSGCDPEKLMSWVPFIKRFRDKYNCEIVCLTICPELFEHICEGIKFKDSQTYRREDPEIYAFYKIDEAMDQTQIETRLGLNE